MTSAYLIPDLKRDEGCKLHAYPDPLTRADPWTIGYGSTGPDIGPNTVWTQDEAEERLVKTIAEVCDDLTCELPWWRSLDDLRQDVLVNMSYNLGVAGLMRFHHMLAALDQGDYAEAAAQMLDSEWATQVKGRATRLAQQMKTGEHQA